MAEQTSRGANAEARRLIAAAASKRSEVLDLGGLALTKVPKELYAQPPIYDLSCVKHLYLGAPEALQEIPYFDRSEEDKKKCNAVSALPPALFSSLPHLNSLHLDQNHLQTLPAGIASLTALTSLNLLFNQIGADGARKLAGLTALTRLDLGDNDIGADGAWALTGLTSLNLYRNNIGADGARALASLAALTSLNLFGNRIGADGTRALAALTGLTSLDLSNNRIGDDGAQALAALTGLTSLNLTGNGIGADGARALAALTGLTSLDLSHNSIGADGARALAPLTGLNSLDLHDNRIGADGARALTALTALTSLNLIHDQIGDDGAGALADLPGLTSLCLMLNEIGAEGARALTALTGLTSLHLGGNRIGADGARALVGLTALTSLNLMGAEIGDDGARALTALTGLTSLDLGGNRIGADGARALAAALTGLTSLDLRDNRIGADGARALASLTTLTWLDLSYNAIGADGAADMSALMNLTQLQTLYLSGCRLAQPVPPLWTLPALSNLYLHDAPLPGVPAEVLSPSRETSCLESLRAHFADLADGESSVTDVKFMILGNGRVGKTQICRMLRGEEYDESVTSTHGVQVSTAPLPLSADEAVTLRIWDFGGQDIYHGTHTLFLKSRAIFPLVWTPGSEAVQSHDYGGFTFRNQPLGYWLDYVHAFGGSGSPVLVIQSQCDEPEQERLKPPAPEEMLDPFPFKKLLHYSAKTDRGRHALNEALVDAVRWLYKKQGVAQIGTGRAAVKARLEAMYGEGKQLLTLSEYEDLCQEIGNVSAPQLLLDYLHNIGTVFYRHRLFDDAIILDQAWALAAVYAALDRKSKAFKCIEADHGRFRRTDLAALVWQDHSKAEQELFLSFMQQCGICFLIRKGDKARGIEPIYVAPDLLPRRDHPYTLRVLKERWEPGRAGAEARLTYELLPPGLMRTLISKIGEVAGFAAEYWRDGFYFYDEATGSKAVVEQRWTRDWAGEIQIQTQGGQAKALLKRVLAFIDERHEVIGARPGERFLSARAAFDIEVREPLFKPGYESSGAIEYFVSYAWGDATEEGREREAFVDRLCANAEANGIVIVRDKTAMRYGDRISKFMERIGRGDRIFIILSDKYLKSAFCMHELFEIWRHCRQDDAQFVARTRVYALPSAKIATFEERTGYGLYWRQQFAKMEQTLTEHGLGILAPADHADYQRMQDFVNKTPNMLRLVMDVLRPGTFDDFMKYGFE